MLAVYYILIDSRKRQNSPSTELFQPAVDSNSSLHSPVSSSRYDTIYCSFQQWTKFENPLRIDKVIDMSLVYYFIWDTV